MDRKTWLMVSRIGNSLFLAYALLVPLIALFVGLAQESGWRKVAGSVMWLVAVAMLVAQWWIKRLDWRLEIVLACLTLVSAYGLTCVDPTTSSYRLPFFYAAINYTLQIFLYNRKFAKENLASAILVESC